MPRLSQSVTATTTTEVELAPSVRRKLLTELKAYAALHTELAAIKEAMAAHVAKVKAIREATGESTIKVDGFTVSEVRSTYRKFNPKKFIAAGGVLAHYNEANEVKPKKPFDKISIPGAKTYEPQEDE